MLKSSSCQRGAAAVEYYIVALFGLLPLCLGMLQGFLLLVAGHHVDHAAFMATRNGATQGADPAAMRREFARVMAPQFLETSTALDAGNVVARVASARARSLADTARFARLRTLSPTEGARRDFAILRDGARVIPADALDHRSTAPGPDSGLTLQQSNMLRVEFVYCQPLVVPFVRALLIGVLQRLDSQVWHQRCYAAGRVPLRSVGTSPMQSDFRVPD